MTFQAQGDSTKSRSSILTLTLINLRLGEVSTDKKETAFQNDPLHEGTDT